MSSLLFPTLFFFIIISFFIGVVACALVLRCECGGQRVEVISSPCGSQGLNSGFRLDNKYLACSDISLALHVILLRPGVSLSLSLVIDLDWLTSVLQGSS